ncbi:MAG: hypothetical protein ACE5ER_00700 [Nitrospinaceae bacterium]
MNTPLAFTELWSGMAFSLPVKYVALVLGFLVLCMVWGKFKLGVVTAMGSFVYWGVEAKQDGAFQYMEGSTIGILVSIFVVLTMSILVLVALFDETH